VSIVVADTSPLNYLIQCEAIELLPKLYHQILIPPAVLAEISHPGAPNLVRHWIQSRPAWLSIRAPIRLDTRIALGRGEVEAICLAEEIKANEILLDDRRARDIASGRGLLVSGTIGVLEAAAKRDLVKLAETIQKLEQTNFRIDRSLLEEVLQRDSRRLEKRANRRGRDRSIER
jgi:predicted nucleic acid-binding protein